MGGEASRDQDDVGPSKKRKKPIHRDEDDKDDVGSSKKVLVKKKNCRSKPDLKVVLSNIVPSDVEKSSFELPAFEPVCKEDEICVDASSQQSIPSTKLPKKHKATMKSDDLTLLRRDFNVVYMLLVYSEKVNKLKKIFDFGVASIGEREWFFILAYLGQPLNIDVLFYYLRKKGKYRSVDASLKFTTTDCWFNCLIQTMYKQFLAKNKDVNLITQEDPIAEYMLGYFMRCNVPWYTVDDIFFLVNVAENWHWILVRLSFKDHCFYIYDSMGGA
ncbi:uncharacterized protein LOC132063987 isoform X2 [Lycium ferocissimum]|uniref:uncharacterized protein LOC132063987 isoform X2 n=1 Tax=Lycium ferocissimum TaxID=112874 RepID=UPI002815353E|nr:uncharacterized protein LOC132063987 isoform X2 [Lycium ferocissimum]